MLCRDRGDGVGKASSISFKIDTRDEQPVIIGEGQGILVRLEGRKLGTAKVLAILPGACLFSQIASWLVNYSSANLKDA